MQGGCVCGDVRFLLHRAPMFVHCCHCHDCQRETGSAFVLNALIERDQVELLSGTPHPVAVPTESGRPLDHYRCLRCWTALWSDYGRRRVMIFVRVGALDDPEALPPDVHIFTRSKLRWVGFPQGVPAVPVYYDMQALWPAESLARRRALLGTEE